LEGKLVAYAPTRKVVVEEEKWLLGKRFGSWFGGKR
jgi:hypothetical protein